MTKAMQRMIAARAAMVLDLSFWGQLTLKLRLREDPSCRSAWVDGHTLGFNPEYVLSLPTSAQVKALWAHEVGHCAHGHPWRRGGRDHDKWNEAADRELNPILRDAGFQLPENVLFELEPSHHGKSAEWVFNRLPHEQEQDDSSGIPEEDQDQQQSDDDSAAAGGAGQPADDEQDESDDTEDEGDEGEGAGEGEGDEGDEDEGEGEGEEDGVDTSKPEPFGGEVRDAPTTTEDGEDIPSEEEWQQAVQQAAAIAAGQGKLPSGTARMVEQLAQPRVDWRSILRRFLQELTRSDYSWVQPNRRYIAQGLYLPALQSNEIGPMVIAIDTSGSIDRTLLSIFGAEFASVIQEMQPRRIHVMYCDTMVHRTDTFEQGEIVEMHPQGGGGTDFRPVFEALKDLDEPPACLVYLTDLWGTFPEDDCGVPTLWVTPKRYAQKAVPFGEVVPVEE